MTSQQESDGAQPIPLEILDLIDAACDRYESARRRGESPRIEDYLEATPPLAIPAMLRELLLLEVDLARESGLTPRFDDYVRRFPEHASLVAAALADVAPGPMLVRGSTFAGGVNVTATTLADVRDSVGHAPSVPVIPGYEFLGELGRGGMGVVHRAREIRLNRVVALKMLPAGILSLPEQVIRFRTEAATVAKIQHPNVVRIHAVGDHEGMPYIEMEFVGGGSLAARLDGTPWAAIQAARMIGALAEGVEEVHRLGVIHRDIKPANVMIDSAEIPKLGDFGLAKDMAVDSGLTRTDVVMGSPSYMAPEQAHGGTREAGPAADVYSLGAVLYELLTGRPPFRGATILQTLDQVKSTEPVPPARLVPGLARDIETICLKCLAKEPARRYASAKALAEDLGRFLRREPILARPVGPIGRAIRWAARNRLAAGLMAAVVVVFCGGFLGMAVFSAAATASATRANENAFSEAATRARSDRFLAGMALDRGITLAEAGRSGRGLHWMAEALRYDPTDGAGLRPAVLANLEAWGRQLPRPIASVAITGRLGSEEFSADGRAFATGGRDGSLSLWTLLNLGQRELLPPGGESFADLAFDSEGLRLAAADAKGIVQVWNTETGRPEGVPLRHPGRVGGLAFRPGSRSLLAVRGEEIWIWDLANPSTDPVVVRCDAPIRTSAFSSDGKVLVTATETNEIRRREGLSGRPIGPSSVVPGVIRSVEFHPDNQSFAVGYGHAAQNATGHGGSGVQLFGPDGAKVGERLAHDAGVTHLRYLRNGRALIAGDLGGTVRLWDTEEQQPIRKPIELDGAVKSLAMSPDGRLAAIASTSGTIRLWDVSSGRIAGPVLDHPGSPRATFRPDGRSVAVVGSRTLTILEIAETSTPSLAVHRSVAMARFLDSGCTLLTAGSDGTARLWDAKDGRPLAQPMPHRAAINAVDIHPDGKTIATGGRDRTVRIWGRDGHSAGPTMAQSHWVSNVRFSLDGRRIVVGRVDNSTQVFDAILGTPSGPFIKHPGKAPGDEVRFVRILPDGKTALSFSSDGTIARIDLNAGGQIGAFWTLPRPLIAIQIPPDGRSLIAIAAGEVHCIDTATGRPLVSPFGIAISSCGIFEKGSMIVTGGNDRTVRFWDAATGEPSGGPIEHDHPIQSVIVDPSGRTLLTLTDAGNARLWDIASRKPIGPTIPTDESPDNGHPSFSPDGQSVVMTGVAASIWPVPASKEINPARVRRDLIASTGLQMDDHGGFARLESEARPSGDPTAVADDDWSGRVAGVCASRGEWAGALWHLDRLVVARPKDWYAHARRARALSHLGRGTEAQTEMFLAETLATADQVVTEKAHAAFDAVADRRWIEAVKELDWLLERRPDDGPLRVERGWARARTGDWAGSNQDLRILANGKRPSLISTYYRTLIALKANDVQNHFTLCQSVAGKPLPAGASAKELIAWICALGPGATPCTGNAIASVEPMVPARSGQVNRLALLALGANLYRAGRFEESITFLERDIREWSDGGSPVGWAFMAMGCRKLGRDREARTWLDKVIANDTARPTSPASEEAFWDGVELQILRAEAEAVVQGAAPGSPAQP